MTAQSKSGGNTISGTAGADHLNGGAGADDLRGLGGNDRINGGSGNDVLDGGAGNDIVSGDSGDDLLIYDLGENVGSTDTYDGGSGRDTLQLTMTRAEWQSPAVQADISRYLAFLAEVTNPVNGQANNRNFTFSSGLTVSKFESLSVIVDGVALDPRDEAVTLGDDVMSAGEETASISVDVLANDSVPDLIASLTNTQPAHGSVVLTQTSGAPGTPDTASFVYTPDASHWQYLAEGQTATDTFTYTVIDSDGDTRTATVTVTITGANDAPVITAADVTGGVTEAEPPADHASSTPVIIDIESNDTFATAQTINRADLRVAPGNTNLADPTDPSVRIQGSVATSADQDVFRIDLQPGETLTLDIDFAGIIPGVGGLDSFVFLYDAAGNLVNFNDDSSTGLGGGGSTSTMDSFLQFVSAAGGTYYIVVKDFDLFGQSSAGTYALNVSVDSQNLQLTDTGAMTFADVDLRDGHTVSVAAEGEDYLGALTAVVSDASTNDGAGGVQWTFSVANAAVQFLAEGETRTQTYVVTVDDGQGGTASETVTITVTGDNDRPTISTAFSSGQVVEGVVPAASGVIAFDDVDLIDGHSVTSAADAAGYLGTFSASVSDAATGAGGGEITWTFSATDAELAYLSEGQSLLQRYLVTIDDGHGGTTQQLVNVTIVGTNDAPTITGAVSSAAIQEDGVVAASGAIQFADVDLRDSHSVSTAQQGAGYLGVFTAVVTDDGFGDGAGSVSWNFAVDNAAIQHLAVGETLTQSYTVTVSDGRGGTVDQVVDVTITGANDAPVVQGVAANATEDGAPVVVAFSADDVDSDDDAGSLTYVVTSTPSEGEVVNNGDGTFSFNPGADFQNLAAGETRDVTFGYEAIDSHGAATPGSVTITVTGTNDEPVTDDVEMGGSSVGAGFPLVFGGYYNYYSYNSGNGQVVFSLVDSDGDGAPDAPGESAALPHNEAGYYYSSVYGLAVGDVDGDGDVDIVTSSDQGLTTFTNIGDTDGDGVANFTASLVHAGFAGYDVALGDLNGDGRLDVVASSYNGVTQLMNAGDANGDGLVNDFNTEIVYSSQQGYAYGYGITTADMNGDGRVDILAANYYGATQLLLNNGDTNGDGAIDYTVQSFSEGYYDPYYGYYGYSQDMGVETGDVDGDGDLDFVLSRWNQLNELVYINDGDTDGDGQLNFRTIEIPTAGYTMESELVDIDGDGDLDVITSDAGYGDVRIAYNQGDTDGDGLVDFAVQNSVGGNTHWSYGLAVGDVDGDGDLDIVLPSLNQGYATYLQNQGDTDGDGQLNFTSVSLTGVGTSWDAEFTPNGGGGGGSGAYEDGPVVTGAFVGDDVDSDDDGDSLTYTITSAPSEGSVVNNGDGTFGFSPGSDFQDLGQGETRMVTFTYTATDAHGVVSQPSTVTIRVAGANDAPVATLDSVAAAEDASVTIDVLANDSDVDGDSLTITHVNGVAIGVNGTVALGDGASVRLDPAGTLTYLPAPNATGVRSFSYTVNDGLGGATTGTVEVNLAQVNDAPVARADAAATDEDTALVLTATSLLANDTDLDGDTLSIASVSAVSARGASVSINAAGDVVYNPGASAELQGLTRGQQLVDTFTYVVTDPSGATSTATVTVTVDGQLEAPVANADTVTVSQNGQTSGDVVANDVVTGSTDNSGNVLVNGSFEDGHNVGPGGIGYPASLPGWTSVQGSFEVWGTGFQGNTASDGNAFLELDNGGGRDAYSSNLTTDVGREYTLAFDLAQRTGTSSASNQVEFFVNGVSLGIFTPPSTTFSTFTVTFIGSGSDVITFREPATANDGVGGLIDNLRIAADADVFVTAVEGDAALVGAEVDGSNGGAFILQSDGSYTFDTDGDFVHLGAGESATTSVTYTVTDDGGSSSTTLSVTVQGENDGPVANTDVVQAAKGAPVTINVLANDSDVDGDALAVTQIDGSNIALNETVTLAGGARVQLNVDGTLTYTPAPNETGVQSFSYTVSDGAGGSTTGTVEVTPAPTVLFIDDDYGLSGESTWLATLAELGYDADYVAIGQTGNVTSDLSQYDIVIWSVGDRAYDNLTAANIATLQTYLDGGGSVLYAGGHSVYQESQATSFIQNYLGVDSYHHNMPTFQNGAQPILATDGQDNVSLRVWAGGQYDNMMSAFNVVAPTARALLELVPGNYSNSSFAANDIVSINDTGAFRAALWGFDLNHIDPANRADVLRATLEALTATDAPASAALAPASKSAPEVSPVAEDDDAFVLPFVDDLDPLVLPGDVADLELLDLEIFAGPLTGDLFLTVSDDGQISFGEDLFAAPSKDGDLWQ